MAYYGRDPSPLTAQTAIVFVDGSGLFERLKSLKVQCLELFPILEFYSQPRELVRAYVYSTREKFELAEQTHGEKMLKRCRLIEGDTVRSAGGTKEKGVDALLVSDLIYHAALKNCNQAILFAHDADFYYPIRRAEDFGCRTKLVSLGVDAPPKLRSAADVYEHVDVQRLLQFSQCRQMDNR